MAALNASLFDMPYTGTRRSIESPGGSDWAVLAFPELSPKLDTVAVTWETTGPAEARISR
jgi:hypothetical protein